MYYIGYAGDSIPKSIEETIEKAFRKADHQETVKIVYQTLRKMGLWTKPIEEKI